MSMLEVSALPKRPGFGKAGKAIKIGLNSFPVIKFPTNKIMQYDVTIGSGTEKRALIRKIWQSEPVQKAFGNARGSVLFDGNKLAWSITPLPVADPFVLEIDLDAEDPRPRRGARDNKHRIVIKKAGTVPLQVVEAFVRGEYKLDNDVISGITFLDHLMRETPSNRFLSIKRSFFKPGNAFALGGGVEAWKGIFQSVRASQGGRLTINVDVATSVFWTRGTVLDIATKCLRFDRPEDLVTKLQANPAIANELRRLKKIQFSVSYRPSGKSKKLTIETFTRGNSTTETFSRTLKETDKKETISVADYYLQQYNIRLKYPSLPLVKTKKKGEMYPMELALVDEGQRYPFKLNDRQTADMIKFTVTKPAARKDHIMKNVALLEWSKDPVLAKYGLKVEPNMIQTNARILDVPKIAYAASSQQGTFAPQDGRWDLRGKKFQKPATLKSWGVMVFGPRRNLSDQVIENFLRTFVTTYVGHGGVVENKRPVVKFANNQQIEPNVNEIFRAAGNQANMKPQLLVFILQQKSSSPYNELKAYCDTKLGVVSQCLQSRHVEQGKPQYCSNVCMKVNAKLGGSNVYLAPADHPLYQKPPTILIGADVSHSAPGLNKPSFASMVGSTDLQGTRFSAVVNTNGQRVEMISTENVLKFVVRILRTFKHTTNQIPERILYFRDGVSEGQYAQVLAEELRDIKIACQSINENYRPTITVTICSKRHHHRFFPAPTDRLAADRNGNVKPGTIVERDITHPTEYDFYLASHSAIQGTARPVHYHVIHDENKIPVDEFQKLVYNTCYTYIRATNAVSLIPAVYYAHLASNRARAHEVGGHQTEQYSSTEVSGEEKPLPVVQDITPLNAQLVGSMWYI